MFTACGAPVAQSRSDWRSACIAAMASMEGADGEWLGLPADGNQNEGLPAHRREELAAEAALLEDKARVVTPCVAHGWQGGPGRAVAGPYGRGCHLPCGWTQRRGGHSFACAHTAHTRGAVWDAVRGSRGPKQGTRPPWSQPSLTQPTVCVFVTAGRRHRALHPRAAAAHRRLAGGRAEREAVAGFFKARGRHVNLALPVAPPQPIQVV